MKKTIFPIIAFAIIIIIAWCKKTDNATNWVGVYTSTGTLTDSINQVTITEVNSTTLQILLQSKYMGIPYTIATIQNAKVQSANTLSVNETGNLAGQSALYNFTGSGTLNGNALILSGNAVNTGNSADTKYYYFSGTK